MRLKNTLLSASAVLMVLSSALVYADSTADAKKAISANYDATMAAFKKGDPNGIMKFYSKDYQSIDLKGKKAGYKEEEQDIQQITALQQFGQVQKLEYKITSFKVNGNKATAVVKVHIAIKGADPKTKKAHMLDFAFASADTWKKTPQGWLITFSRELSQKVLDNGKPIKI